MEKFLGILFCGGRGTRLGEITKYISKSFVPVYDRPVFKYGLKLLENSKYIDKIIILTNHDNNEKLKQTGYETIVQDDTLVFDMFSGWEFIKKITETKKNGILMPSDNISNVNLDKLIDKFSETQTDLVFSLCKIKNFNKLKEMGTYDLLTSQFKYKDPSPESSYGVIAPYVIKNSVDTSAGDNIFNMAVTDYNHHKGYWFDIGDHNSLFETNNFLRKNTNDS